MLTNIAFCPHFHQPHFQMQSIREEVFRDSYMPWLELLQEMQEEPGFFINLHFSGPLLVWLASEKPDYLAELQKLMANPTRFGMVGGLLDEAFTQLSSRSDDILYQVQGYADLGKRLLGVLPQDWQGIHVVERETGEWNLYHLALAAREVGSRPLFYLDTESFYSGHFNYSGGSSDFCQQHFGFNDQHSRTTISHLPSDLLYFGLGDEIGGQKFEVLPIHSEFRYCLLKRQAFGEGDQVVVDPRKYLFILRDAAERAKEAISRLGRRMEPVIVIFEDAEKMGQWSKDPCGDKAWMREFFSLVMESRDLQFSGLNSYIKRQGLLATYPVSSSRSYSEWENWTAHRGIRGVTQGDEKLSRMMSRQRDVESKLGRIDRLILQRVELAGISRQLFEQIVMDSPRRGSLVRELMSSGYTPETMRAYLVIQRIRNIAYQEDPRWASRHPAYGSCSYLDLQGFALLDLAESLCTMLEERLGGSRVVFPQVQQYDWDGDGESEIVVWTAQQMVVIHVGRGQIIFQQARGDIIWNFDDLLGYLEKEISDHLPKPGITRYSQSLVFTETDSRLKEEFYHEGGRIEKCRNSMGESIVHDKTQNGIQTDVRIKRFNLEELIQGQDGVAIRLQGEWTGCQDSDISGNSISKLIRVEQDAVVVDWEIETGGDDFKGAYLVPELVTSAVASDEIDMKPEAWLDIVGDGESAAYQCEGDELGTVSLVLPRPVYVEYGYLRRLSRQECLQASVTWELSSDPVIRKVVITPAVQEYYQSFVAGSQSVLGFESSGIMLCPYIPLNESGKASRFRVRWSWNLEGADKKDGSERIWLLGRKKED